MILKRIRTPALLLRTSYFFGLGGAILHWLRTSLNRIRWEENQQFHAIERRGSTVPKSAQEATQLFIATQRGVSLTEKERMQRIDQILGTRTHFHQGKVYQQRLDSEHIMTIDQLRLENPEKSRKELDWENPQADVKIRYKHKKNYYRMLSQLRVYPTHSSSSYNLTDNTNAHTISFLAAETAYSLVSLKPVELIMESLEQESLLLGRERPFTSAKYCYFRPQHTLLLLRIAKELYKSELVRDQAAINELSDSIEPVISLDEIYEALKDYDYDERVAFFLRKIQNNRLDYLFSDFTLDKEENAVAITIDLTGDSKEYCVLVKSLTNPQKCKPRPLFNLRTPVIFSPDARDIFFVQRSAEGGWIELVSRKIESCWKRGGSELVQEQEGLVYRCSAEKQLQLGRVWHNDFVFVTMSNFGQQYSQSLFLLSSSENALELLPLDQSGDCKYFYDLWQSGVVLGKKRKVSDKLKYGEAEFLIQKLELIPYKQHIVATHRMGLSELQLAGKVSLPTVKPQDLDPSAKKTLFVADRNQFIRQVQARSTHLIIVLNFESLYDRASMYFLPCNPQAHPHSIILRGDPGLQLQLMGIHYNSQLVKFRQFQGLLSCSKQYNIWKRQLSDEEESRYHFQFVTLQTQGHPFELQLLCKKLYLSEKQLPVILVLEGRGERLNRQAMHQLLEKGVMLVKFAGRGTQAKDLEHYFAGSRHNFGRMMDDLQKAIEFIGNELTPNISLYCKGEVTSLVGLWFNFYFPNLFNATVLHNGLYDLSDEIALQPFSDFFGESAVAKEQEVAEYKVGEKEAAENKVEFKRINKGVDLKRFNVLEYKFRQMTTRTGDANQPRQATLGHIQNILITSDNKHRLHSRKLVKRLRQNSHFKFDQVYLKEYDGAYEADLFNFSYLYSNIRKRLEIEINTPKQPSAPQAS